MADKLKAIECDPMCGFMVRSHDEKEVLDIAKNHVKLIHLKDVAIDELRGMLKTIG
jgi:predicted small metal-binding protein